MSRIKNLREEALEFHKARPGKLEIRVTVPARDRDDITLAYSPGVAEPVKEIAKEPDNIDIYTNHANYVSIVSNGTAILGLGDLGAAASLPVMEGKALLFKAFADVDAFPLCVNTKDVDKIVELVELTNPTFGGVNLEDIKAPECFEIEEKLKARGIFKGPIFHDDQHGTAVVTLAGLMNALKIVNKKLEEVKVVANGAGAAGTAIIKLLMSKVLEILENEGLSYEHIPSGIDDISVILSEEGFNKNKEEAVTRRIKSELSVDDVTVERDLALIMLVGEGCRKSIGIAARAASAFAKAGVNIDMINQGSSEVSIMFGVKSKDSDRAVVSLYNEFFN
jgi:malic enzyme